MAYLILNGLAFIFFILGLWLSKWAEDKIGYGSPKDTTPAGYLRNKDRSKVEGDHWKDYSNKLPFYRKIKKIAFPLQIISGILFFIIALGQIFHFLYKVG